MCILGRQIIVSLTFERTELSSDSGEKKRGTSDGAFQTV